MKHLDAKTVTDAMVCKSCVGSKRIEWQRVPKRARGEELLKNIATASALLVCMVTLRHGAIPDAAVWTDTVMAAVTDDSLLDEKLGKLSFVSALFPDSILVFGESTTIAIEYPVGASAEIHTWSEQEPYIAWLSDSTCVFAAISGEVMGIYHGMGEELIVQINNDENLSCIAGNLCDVDVDVGDYIEKGELIGWIKEGSYCTFEVQQNGRSIDPKLLMEDTCNVS